jgi:ribonuclease HI
MLLRDLATSFFDGSSSQYGVVCTSGAVLKLLDGMVYKLRLHIGSGTNSKDELLGLWTILCFARFQKIDHLQAVGDSKLMINWALNKCSLKLGDLDFWIRRICSLKAEFTILEFSHIYREFNRKADNLALQASSLEEGKVFVQLWIDGPLHNDYIIPLF